MSSFWATHFEYFDSTEHIFNICAKNVLNDIKMFNRRVNVFCVIKNVKYSYCVALGS